MDLRDTLRRITLYVLGASALLTLVTFVTLGLHTGLGAVVGALLGSLNWMAMRWVGKRLVIANDRGRLVWGGLLAVKMLAMLLIAWAVLATGVVDPIGFTIGLSGLVLGILAGGFHAALFDGGAPADPDAADMAEES